VQWANFSLQIFAEVFSFFLQSILLLHTPVFIELDGVPGGHAEVTHLDQGL